MWAMSETSAVGAPSIGHRAETVSMLAIPCSAMPAAGADVEPCLARPHEQAQVIERGLVGPVRARPEVRGDRGVEVARWRALTQALGLLAIGAHAAAPGLEHAR